MIINYSKTELENQFSELNLTKYRVKQVMNWIYEHGVSSFDLMTNISLKDRELLKTKYYIYRPELANVQKSVDGSIKFLLKLQDGKTIETVYIPEANRKTVCVSSQVGCAVGCKFCNTGYNGFQRNLTTEEIVTQVLFIKDYLKLWNSNQKITNVVFMGMGEPLYNWKAVSTAIKNLQIGNIGQRKITLSTSGIVPVLQKIIEELDCNLAISLHAPNTEIRSSIMPINDIYNLDQLMDICKQYNKLHPNYLIMFEYLVLSEINDSIVHARKLVKLLHGIKCKVNLIKYNAWTNDIFQGTDIDHIIQFRDFLNKHGIVATIRQSKGQDIMAACGQLAGKTY